MRSDPAGIFLVLGLKSMVPDSSLSHEFLSFAGVLSRLRADEDVRSGHSGSCGVRIPAGPGGLCVGAGGACLPESGLHLGLGDIFVLNT